MAEAPVDLSLTVASTARTPVAATSSENSGTAVVPNAEQAKPAIRRMKRKSSLTRNFEERRKELQNSRVRFREGEELTDSSPAQLPWKDVVPPSCSRVLEMYRVACSKVKVRPLSQVVEFVQNITDFNARQDCLMLKGVRLDTRHCEALEEIFRRVTVNLLNVDGCGLEDDGAMALLEMVEFYEGAHILSMGNNPKLTRQMWLALSRMMKRATFLHYLDLSQSLTDLSALPMVCRSLRANCPLLTLHLERNALAGRRLIILAAALKCNTTLAHLYLGDNGLTADDAVALGQMLKGNRRLELLDIRDNHFLDQGVTILCQALSTQEQGLNALVLWNNRFTVKAVGAMSTMLALHRSLHTLEVGRNRLGNDGMEGLKLGLMRNRSIQRLGIMELGLTTTGTIALAEYIGESPVLETVNVRRNNIRIGGLLALARAHKLSNSLIKLDVDTNIKCDQRDQEILKDLTSSLEEYSFRNQQLAAKRQLDAEQEARLQAESETAAAESSESTATSGEDEHESSEAEALAEANSTEVATQSIDAVDGDDNVFKDDATGNGVTASSVAMPAVGEASTEIASNLLSANGSAGGDEDMPDPELADDVAIDFAEPGAEGLALKAPRIEDEEDDVLEISEQGDEDDERAALKSPIADDSMNFSCDFEAALEELDLKDDAAQETPNSGSAEDNSDESSVISSSDNSGTDAYPNGDVKSAHHTTNQAESSAEVVALDQHSAAEVESNGSSATSVIDKPAEIVSESTSSQDVEEERSAEMESVGPGEKDVADEPGAGEVASGEPDAVEADEAIA
ncbi:protein phosphatase 1 regulatory subunit 37-like [Sycon ciliatum]|uniref:protein phosphatase 1 regulatory subunit 37-like n=1 Tax=Sycon ciliatum TaxID=27933 RepID=UPI0020ABB5EF|eukprot:scpid24573/ scgid4449/ Protein phosphatase 1 regulatory subunit 37; Leucine-rich repeat-containing protein 68